METRAFRALCGPARATSSRVFLGKSLHLSGWTMPKRRLNCEKGTALLYLAFSIEGPLGSLHVDQVRSFLAQTPTEVVLGYTCQQRKDWNSVTCQLGAHS